MASPYFSKMNLPQQDFSALRQAGQAWGEAYQQVGKAVGQIGSAYFKRRGYEKQASQFIKSDMGKEYLKGMGWDQASIDKIDNDPKEAEKLAYDAIREAGGVENVEARMFRMQQAEFQKKQEEIALYNFEDKKLRDEATKEHNFKLGSSTQSPEYVKAQEEMDSLRGSLREASKKLEDSPSPESRRQVGKYLELISQQQDMMNEIPQVVPMTQLDPDSFSKAYGDSKNPYTNMLKQQHMQMLVKRNDDLTGSAQALDRVTKFNRVNSANFVNSGELDVSPAIGRPEATKRVYDQAKKAGVVLDKEGLENALAQIPVIERKEIDDYKKDQYKRTGLDEDFIALESSENVIDLLNSKKANNVEQTTAIVAYAKILQPTGILTEPDIQRVGGSPALLAEFNQAVQKAKDGTMTEENVQLLKEATKTFQQILSENAFDKINNTQTSFGKRYNGLNMDELKKGYFESDYNRIPEFHRRRLMEGEDAVKYTIGSNTTIKSDGEDVDVTYIGFSKGVHIFKDASGNYYEEPK